VAINPMTHLKVLFRKSLSQETEICYRLKLGVMCGASVCGQSARFFVSIKS